MTATPPVTAGSAVDGPTVDLDPGEVLDAAGDCVFTQTRADADLLEIAVRWADLNPVTPAAPFAADWWDGEGVPVHDQIPDVTAAAVVEFAARIGRTTGAGKWLIFEALQLRHRMPRTWRLVRQCRMPAHRARQLVNACYRLNDTAVAWLDRHMDTVAGQIGPAQLERMVDRAAAEHDPDFLAEQRRSRYVAVNHADPNSGIDSSSIHGCLDPIDALDLDAALDAGARDRRAWGSTGDHDARRAQALGDLARTRLGHTTLPLDDTDDQADDADDDGAAQDRGGNGSPTVPPRVSRARELTLYVHLSEQAIHAGSTGDHPDRIWLGECGTTGQTITADLIREWCGIPDLTVNVIKVIDLREPVITDTYRPSSRQREHVALTDGTCGFANCTRPLHPVPVRRKPDGTLADSWDADHTHAWRPGDHTSTDGLVGLCRHHHRSKTLHGWHYRPITPGLILWRSPYGYEYLRTPVGTTSLGRHHRGTPAVPGWLQTPALRPSHDFDDGDEPPPDPADDDIRPPGNDPGPGRADPYTLLDNTS